MKLKKFTQQPMGIALAKQEFTNNVDRELFYLIVNQLKKGFNISYDVYSNLEFNIPLHWIKETNFKRIKEAVIGITNKKIIFINEDLKEVKSIVPFPEASYNRNGIKIVLWNKCVDDFIELSKGYSRYQLEIMQSLKSDYSQRLYEILSGKIKLNNGVWEDVSVEYLKKILNAETYDKVGNFMQKVIVVAKNELDAKADLSFEVDKIKTGRRITHLAFNTYRITLQERIEEQIYQDYELMSKLDNVQKVTVINNIIKQHSFTTKQQELLMSNGELFDKFYRLDKEIEEGVYGEVDDPTAYIAKSLGFDK